MSHLNVVRGFIDAKQKIPLVKRFSFFFVLNSLHIFVENNLSTGDWYHLTLELQI